MSDCSNPTRRTALMTGAGLLLAASPLSVFAETVRAVTPAGDKTVIELFTSQACPKCPPANAFLTELAQDDRFIALSLPVDMWDFMGWKDRYARPEHTIRQKVYNKRLRNRSAFTPQMVVDGMEFASGGNRKGVEKAIEKCRKGIAERVRVDLDFRDDTVNVAIGDGAAPERPATVYLMAYRSRPARRIRSGANRGKMMHYTNAVFAIESLGPWTGEALALQAPIPKTPQGLPSGIAVVVQEDGTGPIIGAEKMDFYFQQ